MNELDTKIAERLGWKELRYSDHLGWYGTKPDGLRNYAAFTTSLDACAELRKGLTAEQRLRYAEYLHHSAAVFSITTQQQWWLVDIPAETHCAAFLSATQPEAGK